MKKNFQHSAKGLFIAACALALTACGGDSPTSGQVLADQAKQLHRSEKAAASSYDRSVQALYIAYFGRPADPNGLVNFENELAAANAPTDIAGLVQAYATNPQVTALINSFETSAESNALYGSATTTAFVTSIFQNVLGRPPAAQGLAFWVNAIDSGSLTQGDAALSIMAGAMSNTTPQGLLDAQLINNRLAVADYFTSQLSTQNIVSAYSGHNAASIGRLMLNAVSASTSVADFEANDVGASFTSLLASANGTPLAIGHGVRIIRLAHVKQQWRRPARRHGKWGIRVLCASGIEWPLSGDDRRTTCRTILRPGQRQWQRNGCRQQRQRDLHDQHVDKLLRFGR